MKRLLLSSALSGLGVATSVLRLRHHTRSAWLTVLTYHRAGPAGSLELIDEGVVAATAAGFERQVAFCRRYFNVVGIDDVLAHLRGAPLPRSPLLITFDDGYLDNYEVAFPVLRKHGMKAVFFVASSYIDERKLFWWDRIHFLLKSSAKDVIELSYPVRNVFKLRPAAARDVAIRAAIAVVKNHCALDLPRFLEHLAGAAGVDLDSAREQALVRDHVMTWEHIQKLSAGGMDVQSHTHTHRVLHTLPPHQLADDLLRSRLMLESVLDKPVRALAYPVGKAPEYPTWIRNAVRAAGYDLGFSNRSGINLFARFDALDTKRIDIDPTFSDAYFATVMALPRLLACPPSSA